MGFEVRFGDSEIPLFVRKAEQDVCRFDKNGAMRYFTDLSLESERKALKSLMFEMKQAHDHYADARPLAADGLGTEDGYRLISEFGGALLAANQGNDNEVRFVTWEYDYDRKGYIGGIIMIPTTQVPSGIFVHAPA